jgi:AmmeMemoRadiSam system protein A
MSKGTEVTPAEIFANESASAGSDVWRPDRVAEKPLDRKHERILLHCCARTLAHVLFYDKIVYPDPTHYEGRLVEPGATFVTYEHRDELVGCIGSIEPEYPLVLDAARNSLLAAFSDPRTPGLPAYPLRGTSMKISVLFGFEPLPASDFDEVRELVTPGHDGIVLSHERRRATLLPSVWEKVDSVEEFLDVLWRKAGLEPRTFDTSTSLTRYSAQEIAHPDLAELLHDQDSPDDQEP